MIAIIDYQMGNLRSVQKGFEKVGYRPRSPAIRRCWPRPKKSCCPASEHSATPWPSSSGGIWSSRSARRSPPANRFSGICLGLQLLFDVGYEGGRHEGLGVLAGEVVRFDLPGRLQSAAHGLEPTCRSAGRRRCWPAWPRARTAISSTPTTSCRAIRASIATETDYGRPFCSMVWRDNIFATQFHPEKSQADGLKILSNFAAVTARCSQARTPVGRGFCSSGLLAARRAHAASASPCTIDAGQHRRLAQDRQAIVQPGPTLLPVVATRTA